MDTIIKQIPQIHFSNVKAITLPSVKQWDEWKEKFNLPIYSGNNWWTLDSYNNYNSVYVITSQGEVNIDNIMSHIGIRPLFILKQPFTNIYAEIGGKILIGDIICTLISVNYALADYVIDMNIFDNMSDNYNFSLIRKYLDSVEFWEKIGLYKTNLTFGQDEDLFWSEVKYGETD